MVDYAVRGFIIGGMISTILGGVFSKIELLAIGLGVIFFSVIIAICLVRHRAKKRAAEIAAVHELVNTHLTLEPEASSEEESRAISI
jgi:hypothetical protein